MSNSETFKISAALKDLIGRELITDEFVAVFELVKNSFDANAKKVEVIFENNHDQSQARIIIKDNGKGMDYNDIQKKWLFVAYSAKKTGKENDDYRDKIRVNRIFAGAKGVGRFSCDRLGRYLNLITIKDSPKAKIENLNVNWEDFENADEEEFINIKVEHEELIDNYYNLKNGTVLEISGLRDVWDRDRILKLKRSLVKLINPNQENDSDNFEIDIIAKDELDIDKLPNKKGNKRKDWDIVNGKVTNAVFETLEIKTTNILVEITRDGNFIETTLQDRGDLIYYLKEKNPFVGLSNIKTYLFQLNRSAKYSFSQIMGMPSVEYGAVFMYKNGFRIYPYGEPGEDLLLIDRRKQQGYNRFLGTRDLIGRIEINGDQSELKETTTRDGGLIKTKTYYDLVNFFYDYVLTRLENYVVNVIRWGDDKIIKETGEYLPELWPNDVKVQILELITGFINSKNIIDIQYNKDFLNIIAEKQDKSVEKIIKNISKVAEKSGNAELIKEAKKIEVAVKESKEDLKRATEKAEQEERFRQKAEQELSSERLKTEFLKKQLAPDADALIHHIKNNNISIKTTIENILHDINDDNYSKEDLVKDLTSVLFHSDKAIKAANIITHVDLSESDLQNVELAGFINGYIHNISEITNSNRINIKHTHSGEDFNVMISKPEFIIVLDNLIDNSVKWGAQNILIKTNTATKNNLTMLFSDDGKGLSEKYINEPSNIFKFRETDSVEGTGIGMNIVKDILDNMDAKISFKGNNSLLSGCTFQIDFRR